MKAGSSLDDLLSTSPSSSFSSVTKAEVLEPKRITEEEVAMRKEEERKESMTFDKTDPYTSK